MISNALWQSMQHQPKNTEEEAKIKEEEKAWEDYEKYLKLKRESAKFSEKVVSLARAREGLDSLARTWYAVSEEGQ